MPTIQELAEAIATAEGYYVPGSRPQKSNNPGSLFPGGKWGVYATRDQGWNALRNLLNRALTGRSGMFKETRTWRDFAWMYVNGTLPSAKIIHQSDAEQGGPDQWLRNVLRKLDVPCSPDCEWRSYIRG